MKNFSFLNITIPEIIQKYKNHEINSLDVAKICILQHQKFEKAFHAWAIFSKEHLVKQAKQSSQYLLETNLPRDLEGIPIGIKDIFNTIDFPTGMGSPLWSDFQAGNDARVVSLLKQLGAIIPGKTTTAEFAVHSLLVDTLNPHDKTKIVGTSSSGSAVAVAVGMVPVALGTQTAGSIVRPSSYCGVFGFKPSFGLIPRTGVLKTADTLDTIGFLSNQLDNIPIIFDAIRVKGHNYPISNRFLHEYYKNIHENKWHVGFVKTPSWIFAESYAKESIIKFVKTLSHVKNIMVDEAYLPPIAELSWKAHDTIYNKSLSHYFQKESLEKSYLSKIIKKMLEAGKKITAEQYYESLNTQNKILNAMDIVFNHYDILISLSTAGQAPNIGENEKPDPSLMWTMAHLPILSIPQFISPIGLPFGMQVVARKYGDLKLLKFVQLLRSLQLIPQISNPIFNK